MGVHIYLTWAHIMTNTSYRNGNTHHFVGTFRYRGEQTQAPHMGANSHCSLRPPRHPFHFLFWEVGTIMLGLFPPPFSCWCLKQVTIIIRFSILLGRHMAAVETRAERLSTGIMRFRTCCCVLFAEHM